MILSCKALVNLLVHPLQKKRKDAQQTIVLLSLCAQFYVSLNVQG